MAFVRRRRRVPWRGRRRGRRPETYTLADCRSSFNIWSSATCNSIGGSPPPIIMTELFSPAPTVGSLSAKAPATIGTRGFSVRGIKFQSEFLLDPFQAIFDECGEVTNPNAAEAMITLWEQIVLLPLAETTDIVPAYLPFRDQQEFDNSDRVLWKRINHLRFIGAGLAGSHPVSTQINEGAGPQVVKSRVFIDDRHALFYSVQVTHNLFLPTSGVEGCELPLFNDNWFKIYYNEIR